MTINAKKILKKYSLIFIIILLMSSSTIGVSGLNYKTITSCDKGPAYKAVVPLKKATFIQYDENSNDDDYLYLAAVPTSIFNQDDYLFCSPLLFYQDEYKYETNKERTFNARQGIDYFMEDWMKYSNNQLDQLTLLNVEEQKIPAEWKARSTTVIDEDNIYDAANKLALEEWSYANDAVIAIVDEQYKPSDYTFNGELTGKIDNSKDVIHKTFYSEQVNKVNPRFHDFEVPEGYKYLKARTWWASIGFGQSSKSDVPIALKITIPTADPDSQFYCKFDSGEWLQVDYTQEWNMVSGMDVERAQMYVYNSGPWRLSITDVPTFGLIERYGTFLERLRNMIFGVTYQTDISIYPGVQLTIPENPPFGCRDIDIELTWDNDNIDLGMSLIGPAGEEVISATDGNDGKQSVHLGQLGQCPQGKNYSIAVYNLNESDSETAFRISYSWRQNITEDEADGLTSATEGSVLASHLNAPLLYASSSQLRQSTINTLNKLGVKKIYVVDFGDHIDKDVIDNLKKIAPIKQYTNLEKFYSQFLDLTKQNDIIVTTIDPWTKWLVAEKKPYEETKAALFIGPAAYCAAYHGSPVFIVDNHPELSSAVVWHTEFWKRHGNGQPDPPGAPMSLTGRQAYRFFDRMGFDQQGLESMVTIAGQYDIGAPWDRTFVGRSYNGKFFGSPVDVSYWISRNLLYPSLIFNNPSLDNNANTYIQGSTSERRTLLPFGPFGLKVVSTSEEQSFSSPAILHSYICYNHRLNDVFQKYYGFQYECRDDIVPGVSASPYEIDEGVVPGKVGAIWPDFSATEANPYYFDKGGYANVFSTGYNEIVNNLNNGILLWNFGSHGSANDGGFIVTWPAEGIEEYIPFNIPFNVFGYEKESNPWRGYDFIMGSTDQPDAMTMNVHGILAGILGDPNLNGLFPLGVDYTVNIKPYRQSFFKLLSYVPIIGRIVHNNPWLADSSYFKDGIVGASIAASITVRDLNGTNFDDDLENVYSCGWLLSACLPAYKYVHLAMIRHGSAFQVMDPWPTSWYAYWAYTMPRDMILGDTVGQAYTKGISHVGKLYATDPPEWWWDAEQNLVYFGDPDLRFYVPTTNYSDNNYWTIQDVQPLRYDASTEIQGHCPFGATSYPHQREPMNFFEEYYIVIISLAIIILLLIITLFINRKK